MISEFLGRKYKLAKNENFDDYMKAVGVGFVTRKMGNTVSPVMELTEKDGEFTLTSNSTFKNTAITFKLGVEFDEETPDGRKVKSTITQEGNKLIQIQKGDKTTTIVREFKPDEVVTCCLALETYIIPRLGRSFDGKNPTLSVLFDYPEYSKRTDDDEFFSIERSLQSWNNTLKVDDITCTRIYKAES